MSLAEVVCRLSHQSISRFCTTFFSPLFITFSFPANLFASLRRHQRCHLPRRSLFPLFGFLFVALSLSRSLALSLSLSPSRNLRRSLLFICSLLPFLPPFDLFSIVLVTSSKINVFVAHGILLLTSTTRLYPPSPLFPCNPFLLHMNPLNPFLFHFACPLLGVTNTQFLSSLLFLHISCIVYPSVSVSLSILLYCVSCIFLPPSCVLIARHSILYLFACRVSRTVFFSSVPLRPFPPPFSTLFFSFFFFCRHALAWLRRLTRSFR